MDEDFRSPISHSEIYLKLGKLEGLMETMMASVTVFQSSIKDVHTRIDRIEGRQAAVEAAHTRRLELIDEVEQIKRKQESIELSSASSKGALSAILTGIRDFAVPLLALVVTWMVAVREVEKKRQPSLTPSPEVEVYQQDNLHRD